jgi:hypothetical protein
MLLNSDQIEKLNVFVSYSRPDQNFADELVGGLEFAGATVTIDRHSIREGEEWKVRLSGLIADADTIVFILSPDSAKSPICAWEVAEASALGKRILPVLWRPLEDALAPARLADLNYVRFDEGRSFIVGLKGLVTALNTDLDWLRDHTRLLARALEWERGGRSENRLLSGKDVIDAKALGASRPRNAAEITQLQLDYIRASEDAETARNDATRRQIEERSKLLKEAEQAAEERAEALRRAENALKASSRLQRRQAVGSALVVIILAAVGWWAYGVITERRAIAIEAAREDIRGQIVSAGFAREIAAREGVNERFVRRLIPLAFLSPAIVEAIADGRQPVTLSFRRRKRGNVPNSDLRLSSDHRKKCLHLSSACTPCYIVLEVLGRIPFFNEYKMV